MSNKSIVSLYLNRDTIDKLKANGVNVSQLVNDFLETRVSSENSIEKKVIEYEQKAKEFQELANQKKTEEDNKAKLEHEQFLRAKTNKEKEILEGELYRLNSIIMRYSEPGGTDRPEPERIALLTTYIEKAKELRGKILDMENSDPVVNNG